VDGLAQNVEKLCFSVKKHVISTAMHRAKGSGKCCLSAQNELISASNSAFRPHFYADFIQRMGTKALRASFSILLKSEQPTTATISSNSQQTTDFLLKSHAQNHAPNDPNCANVAAEGQCVVCKICVNSAQIDLMGTLDSASAK
jgi:hypothetical protein